jgi:carbamoyltransferase
VYSRVTFMMGFTPWEHEYKLMGLAPYASRRHSGIVAEKLRGYLDLDPADAKRFRRLVSEPTNHLVPRLERDLRRQRFDSIAGGVQQFTEELVVRWVRKCVESTGISRVLAAGGVFMNIKANKLISELPEVSSFEAFPSCGDETNVFGGGWVVARCLGDSPAPLTNFYMGGSFDDAAVTVALEREAAAGGLVVQRLADANLQTARWLADGHIVARASGRMEFGARALGNRSILADPSRPAVVPIINALIKSRDFWMPFAPMTRARGADRYVRNPKSLHSPYMMMGFETTPNRAEFVAGIHPADGSARMQLLEDGQNPDVEQLLGHFESLTRRGVLLNTSFNLHGSPIAYTPEEALHVFRNSGLTHLVIGGYGVVKEGGLSA